jgi:septal ring factor EnvC (AmiA/AmiB activator)
VQERKAMGDKGSASDNKSDNKIELFKQRAKDISRKIEKSKVEVLMFTRQEAAIINSLNETDLSLNNARKRVSSIKLESAALEKKIEESTNLTKELVKRIEISEEYASRRLVAFYKLNWLGRMHVLASAESMYEFFQRERAMEQILAYDENILKNLAENKSSLEKLLGGLNSQKMAKLSLEADLKEQIRIMSQQKAKRSELLEDIRNKKSLEMAAIESLKESAKTLDQTIKSLSLESNRTKQVENIPPQPFILLKGLLQMPVKGRIIFLFGPYKDTKFNVLSFRSGIDIQADRGEPVHSVSRGQVLYSSWFKGYGNMIIIDHGDNYYTVYANVEELFKTKGDKVETGEVIATVGDTGSRIGPKLYFEVRYHGKPVDPLQWIKKG